MTDAAWKELIFEKKIKKKVHAYRPPAPLAPLADTHAHLTCFWTKDPAKVLARAALAGVQQLTTLVDPVDDRVALDYPAWLRSQLQQASALGKIPEVRFLAGVHPYGAARYTDAVHAKVEALLQDPLCVGVGEIGLDYHFDEDDAVAPVPHDVQIACFERQFALAVDEGVPVELHLRNDASDTVRSAHADALLTLQRFGVPASGCIVHCFGEDRATMECFLELGCYIAFGGAATFGRNEHVREAFAACPLDRILFETDCPYMAPMPLRGLECEPAMIAFTADALSRDRAARTGEDPAVIQLAAWENACFLLGKDSAGRV